MNSSACWRPANLTAGSLQRICAIASIAMLCVVISSCGLFSKKSDSSAEASTGGTTAEAPQDAATRCRQSAPEDPNQADAAAAQTAMDACKEALVPAPNDPELIYLEAVSALGAEHADDALAAFQQAAKLGYCKAFYFLGDYAWHGKDADAAEQNFKQGAACGDPRAAHEIFSPDMFAASAYPKYIAALYNSDMQELNHVRFFAASYVAGFYDTLSEQYLSENFSPCWAASYYKGGDVLYSLRAAEKGDAGNIIESLAYEKSMPVLYHVLFPDQGEKALDEVRETARKAGHGDVIRMVQASGCGKLLPYKIVKGIETFAATKKSLLTVAQEVIPEVHSFGDLTSTLTQRGQGTTR